MNKKKALIAAGGGLAVVTLLFSGDKPQENAEQTSSQATCSTAVIKYKEVTVETDSLPRDSRVPVETG